MSAEERRSGALLASLAVVIAVVAAGVVQGFHAADTDLYYHLASGRQTVADGAVLDHESFTFTRAGVPWTNYHWAFQVVLYGVHALGGMPGLIVLRAALILGAALLLLRWCRARAGGDALVALGVALLVFAVYYPRAINLRSHHASYLLLIVLLMRLERSWREPRRIDPLIPLLCVPWANTHGVEQPVVLATIAVYGLAAAASALRGGARALLDRSVWRWPLLVVACAAAFLVNPFGARLLATGGMALDGEAMSYIAEMQPYRWQDFLVLVPPSELAAPGALNLVALLALASLPGWVARGDLRSILLFALGLALVAARGRFAVELALLVSGGVAEELARWRASPDVRRALAKGASIALVALVALAAFGTLRGAVAEGRATRATAATLPAGAARFLRDNGFAGNLLNPASVGGYLEWELAPSVRVFADMRTPEPVDARTIWMHRSIHLQPEGDEPRALLADSIRRWEIGLLLFARDNPLARELARQPGRGFRLVWADARWVLFAHESQLAGQRESLALRALDPFEPSFDYASRMSADEAAALAAECERLVAVDPENHLALQARLALSLGRGEHGRALAEAERLADLFPREGNYRWVAGLALQGLGRDAEAFERLRAALGVDPANASAARAAGRLALALERPAEGRALLEDAVARQGYRAAPADWALLGALRSQAGAGEAAADAYERALATSAEPERRAEIGHDLGVTLIELGRPGEALEAFDRLAAHGVRTPEIEFHRGRALSKLGDEARASAVFRGLAEDPRAPASLRARAQKRLSQP